MSLIALHYEFKEKIGTGSFGTVYRVEDIATNNIFAIKLLGNNTIFVLKSLTVPL